FRARMEAITPPGRTPPARSNRIERTAATASRPIGSRIQTYHGNRTVGTEAGSAWGAGAGPEPVSPVPMSLPPVIVPDPPPVSVDPVPVSQHVEPPPVEPPP